MTHSRPLLMMLGLLIAAALAACQPDLGDARGRRGEGGGGGAGEASLSFALEPASEADAAPLALRIRIRSTSLVDPSLVRFVKGEVGPGHLKQLALGAPSNALEKRILGASVWREGDDVVVAPHALLEGEEVYAVAVPDHEVAFVVRARATASDTTLLRLWPPADVLASSPMMVFCGEADLLPIVEDVALAPDQRAATLARGAASNGVGARCVRVQASDTPPDGTLLLPPPAFESGGVACGLEPTPLVIGTASLGSTPPLVCDALELPFGPGCVRVLDDRAFVRTPVEGRLWVVGGQGVDLVVATAASEPFVVFPLAPGAENALELRSFDAAGREMTATFDARTSQPMPHLVLNEALANAVGPEPASEWVEIVNDGSFAVSLAGYVLADLGGEVELPDLVLAPSEIALIVGDGWTGDGLDDVAPPADALIVRVPRVGRSGIANGGEPLRLRDASGTIVSTIPAIASPDPGMSTARREPWLADAPSSFVSAVPTPGEPNR